MIARFDNFEIDTTECRISREGETIRLARQPLDLLILLIERRGKLVTREEIASALWGGSAFVDAEHGINNAIRKIRDALGDDPSNPRWIETVVRRGYRFKAPAAAASLAASEETPGAPALAEPDAPVQAHPSSPTRAHRRLTVVAVGIAAMALSLFAIGEITTSSGPGLRWTPLTRATRVHTNLPLAADTRFVYWTEYNELGCRPMRVPLAGGDPLPVPMPFPSAFVLDSDSGGRLLVNVRENCKNLNAEGAVWELDAQTGSAHRVGDLTAQAGGFSADGGRIVLARGRELWTASRDGSGAKRIATGQGLVYFARWSPDGSTIRFSDAVASPVDEFVLREIDGDGQQLRNLIADRPAGNSSRWGGVWSAAARGFVYEVTRRGSTDLWRLRNRGWFSSAPAAEQLTAGPLDFGSPAAIPGRDDLVVTGTRRQGILQRYDAVQGRFVPFLRGISAEMVDFSRDRQWVAYVTFPDLQLWRSRADGSQALQLTQAPMRAGLPRISPDMRQIAFSAERQEEGWRVYTIPFDGGTPRLAMPAGSRGQVAPTWSRDGKQLLFRGDSGGDRVYNNVLQVLDLSSRQVSTLPNSRLRFNQRFSPTEDRIVATPNDESELDLYDVGTKQWSVLAKMQADYPSWSADGRFVYFVSNTPEHGSCIYRVQVDTRQAEFVASLRSSERAIDDSWGQWAGVTPEGSPLIIANDDLQQIYLLSFGGH